ncbi:MAG: hypothetical protein R2749_28775 [Acidimicrobiales bacterium]
MVGGGLFAVTQWARRGRGRGRTPEAAVEQFFTALNNEDMLGMMNALPRGERETFVPLAQDSLAELKRIGVLADGAALDGITGLDINVTGYRLSSREVADTVANVTVSGATVDGSYDLQQLPLGSVLVDVVFGGEVPDERDSSTGEEADDLTLTTVRDGDGWHVSLWYSVAEAARDQAGLPAPPFGNGVAARGADSPEGAVEDLFGAMGELDVRRMIELAPPDEMAALHDYAPLFLGDAEDAIDDLRSAYDFSVEVRPTGLEVEGSGDTRIVTMGGFEVDFDIEGSGGSITLDGSCVTFEIEGDRQEQCAEDQLDQLNELGVALPASYTTLLDRLAEERSGFQVRQVDGAWYVSPMGTMGHGMLQLMRALDEDLLRDLIDDSAELGGDLAGGGSPFGSSFPFGSVDLNTDDFGSFDDFDDFDDSGFDDFDDSGSDDDFGTTGTSLIDPVDSGYDEYYAACGDLEFEVYLAEDPATWATATAIAHACALPYLQAGDITEFDVASEVARPECYPSWPYDPNLTLGQQNDLFTAIDSCLKQPAPY